MNYWLMKSEPDLFGIEHLEKKADQTEPWDGVRNYQARNMLRDQMKCGDLAFFYHSNCAAPGIAGIMEVRREAYPDCTAFDAGHAHFDPKSKMHTPTWYMVDMRYVRRLNRHISLAELKACAELAGFPLVQRGTRLSILPVSESHWRFILGLE